MERLFGEKGCKGCIGQQKKRCEFNLGTYLRLLPMWGSGNQSSKIFKTKERQTQDVAGGLFVVAFILIDRA